MSELESARLRRAEDRMMYGQQEALGIARAALEAGPGAHADDALADLQGTLEDARADLGIGEGVGEL